MYISYVQFLFISCLFYFSVFKLLFVDICFFNTGKPVDTRKKYESNFKFMTSLTPPRLLSFLITPPQLLQLLQNYLLDPSPL